VHLSGEGTEVDGNEIECVNTRTGYALFKWGAATAQVFAAAARFECVAANVAAAVKAGGATMK
jgi:hypothetical protein